jgi:uncharacterized membrane protein
MQLIIAYGASAVVFFGLDLLWLGVIARGFYARQMGDLLREQPGLGIAGLFYAGYVGGIVLFAVLPSQSWRSALLLGLALGVVAYGTYDFTNLATLRRWPVGLALVDLAWGSVLTGLAATAGYLAVRASGAGAG